MKKNWFKKWGWGYQPVSWEGVVVTVAAALFCLNVFQAIDRNSHSVSDTLYGIFPFWVCTFVILFFIASRTSK